MRTRVVRVATAGIVLAWAVAAVGIVEAEASNPGNNGRLVYADVVEVEPYVWVSEIYRERCSAGLRTARSSPSSVSNSVISGKRCG
jgi:hypothetical protein